MASILGSSLYAMAVIFAMIASGTFLRAQGTVTATGQREMANIAVKLLLPAFNFTALITDVTWEKLEACRLVVLFAMAHVMLGLAFGVVLCRVGRRTSPFFRAHWGQTLVLCAFCNGTAMPLPLFKALLAAPELGGYPGAEAEGTLAITIYGAVWRFLLWTLGIALLEAEAAQKTAKPSSPMSLLRTAFLNANTFATVSGIAIALAGAQGVVFWGPFAFLREACANIARAGPPVLLFTLGAALWPMPAATDLGAVVGISMVKLVALPTVTLAMLYAGGVRSVSGLVLAIEGCVPSALQISMMVQNIGLDARQCTVICFWQHVFALATMTTFLSFALLGV